MTDHSENTFLNENIQEIFFIFKLKLNKKDMEISICTAAVEFELFEWILYLLVFTRAFIKAIFRSEQMFLWRCVLVMD